MRVLLLAGGRSAEWEISLVSAEWVSKELRNSGHTVTDCFIERNGSWMISGETEPLTMETTAVPWRVLSGSRELAFDVVFPVLHGSHGEDGTVQGLCATAGWPCAGVPVLGCALAMEKHTMKKLAMGGSIPVVPWVLLDEDPSMCFQCMEEEIAKLGFPLFVKPSRLGSSVGITRVDSPEGLPEALAKAAGYDTRILVEKAVEGAREIEVSLLGNGSEVLSSVPGEVVPGREWYDYEAKYDCLESRLEIPAPIPPSLSENIRMMAERAFRLLGGRGFARADFLLGDGGVWLNEINTIPGFTSISMFPKLWEATGMSSKRLLDFILTEAVERPSHGLFVEQL